MMEFLSCWKAKQEATINIQCKEGRAMLNFSCSLGEPEQPHVAEGNLRKKRKAKKTKSQIRRDAARAAALSPPPPSKRHNGKNKWQHILDWERSEFPAARSGPAAKVPPSLDQPSPEKLRHQQEEDEPFNDSELPGGDLTGNQIGWRRVAFGVQDPEIPPMLQDRVRLRK